MEYEKLKKAKSLNAKIQDLKCYIEQFKETEAFIAVSDNNWRYKFSGEDAKFFQKMVLSRMESKLFKLEKKFKEL